MRWSTRICVFGVALVLAVAGIHAAQASRDEVKSITFYEDGDGDGNYEPTIVYDVAPEEALKAYETYQATEGSAYRYQGTTHYFSGGQGQGEDIGPVEEFESFLSGRYPSRKIMHTPACDAVVGLAWTISCPFSCTPPTSCTNWVAWTLVVTCYNDPACPIDHACGAFPGRIIGITTNQQACVCTPNCTPQAGTIVTGFTASGPVCECVHTRPTLSGWGLILLALLLVTLAVFVFQKRMHPRSV